MLKPKQEPPYMRMKKSHVNIIGVIIVIDMFVMITMIRNPFESRFLKGCCSKNKRI